MIVSASYRTDIPAFYGDWFARRLAEGFCDVKNPYGGKPYRVALRGPDVDGFVFWTRNARPFFPVLESLARDGVPFVVQYTITGYPDTIDTATPPAEHGVAAMRDIAERFGGACAVWRYDPILVSSATPLDSHEARFTRLADALSGTCDEVVMSFAHLYRKTVRNLGRAEGLSCCDPDASEKADLTAAMADIAQDREMNLTLCTEPELAAAVARAAPARCVDVARLSRIAGRAIKVGEKGNRPGCLCAQSRDIGAYDTCAHGCLYCYAVGHHRKARTNLAAHDALAERLG